MKNLAQISLNTSKSVWIENFKKRLLSSLVEGIHKLYIFYFFLLFNATQNKLLADVVVVDWKNVYYSKTIFF